MIIRYRQRGFSLTEMAIVLGIVGVVIGGIWAAAAMVSRNRLIQQQKQDLTTIVEGMRTLYAGKVFANNMRPDADYYDWQRREFSVKMDKYGVYPADLERRTGVAAPNLGIVRNREGGSILIYPWSNSAVAANNVFEVEFFGTPRTCQRLAFEMARSADQTGLLQIYTVPTGWANPADVTFASVEGCGEVSFAFRL